MKDQARRFITLVDELYNARTCLVCTAACAPDELFAGAGGREEPILDLEALQFETAVQGVKKARGGCVSGGSMCWCYAYFGGGTTCGIQRPSIYYGVGGGECLWNVRWNGVIVHVQGMSWGFFRAGGDGMCMNQLQKWMGFAQMEA